MTAAEYEAIKAQVLEEQRAERRARAKERERISHEVWHMFDPTISEYLPKMVVQYAKKTGNYDCAHICKERIEDAIRAALGIIGERNRKTAYLNGRVDEANETLKKMLEQIVGS